MLEGSDEIRLLVPPAGSSACRQSAQRRTHEVILKLSGLKAATPD